MARLDRERVEEKNEDLKDRLARREATRWWQRGQRQRLDREIAVFAQLLAEAKRKAHLSSPEGLAARRKFDEGIYDVRMRLAAQQPDPRSSDPESPDLRWHTWER